MEALMVTSFKWTYAIHTPRTPVPEADHCRPVPQKVMLKHSSVSVSVGSWVLVHTKFIWALWTSLVGMGFDSNCEFTPPTIGLGLLLCLLTWVISSWLVQQSAAAAPDLGHGVSIHGYSSEVQALLLTLEVRYLLPATCSFSAVHLCSYFTHPSKEYFV